MRVLITGATGFVGTELTNYLLKSGYEVFYLTTSKNKIQNKVNHKGFYWNPNKFEIDSKCIEGVDFIVNLSGKSISFRWNTKNKKEILQSRINSSKTLYKLLSENNHKVNKIISASAIGIYRNDFKRFQSEEETKLNKDFLGMVCQEWENENQKFNELGIETLIVRFGLVLSNKKGALPQFANTTKLYLSGLLGSGMQWYSWIHILDLVEILIFGMKSNVSGIVNGVSPNPKTQKDFLITLAKILKRKMMMFRIPTWLLKVVLGEMHHLITDSQKVSSNKLLNLGFEFKYPMLKDALRNLYLKK